MNLKVFDGMSAAEIHDYTKMRDDSDEEFERLEKLLPLYKLAFFGPQFTNTPSSYLILYKNGILRFIWKNDFNKPLYEGIVNFDNFSSVFNEYIDYCAKGKLQMGWL